MSNGLYKCERCGYICEQNKEHICPTVTQEHYDHAVMIGRFQPFHLGHAQMLETALTTADNVVIVLGSARAPRSVQNPFGASEREEMIRSHLRDTGIEQERVTLIPVRDYFYNDNLWVAELQEKVRSATGRSEKVALIGYRKDESSYYLDLFPSWTFLSCKRVNRKEDTVLSATDVRRQFLTDSVGGTLNMGHLSSWPRLVPSAVRRLLVDFQGTPEYERLAEEQRYLVEYPTIWGKGPFVTVDAVVMQAGHVLVIERGAAPGKGLYALPGGFLGADERLVDAMLRELKEETEIPFSTTQLKDRIIGDKVFDHPARSQRGRTITHAYHLDLPAHGTGAFPTVNGADDAARAFWMPLYDAYASEEQFYEDHLHIIRHFAARI